MHSSSTFIIISSVITQKGESQNGCFKKRKHAKFSKKRTFFLTSDTHTYVCISGGKKCSFFGKFGVLSFLETPVLRFALLSYYRRYQGLSQKLKKPALINEEPEEPEQSEALLNKLGLFRIQLRGLGGGAI